MAASSGAISAWAAASGPAISTSSRWRSSRTAVAGLEQGRVPEAQLGARRLLLPDEPEEAVALLEGPPVGGEVPRIGRRALAGHAVEGLPAQRRGAGDEQHLLGGEQHGPEHAREGGGAARDPVHADALANASARGLHERDLEGVAILGRRSRPTHPRLNAGQLTAPAHELAVGARPVRATPGQQDDGLEQARLAGRVGAPHQLRAGVEHGVERRVRAQVADGETPEDRGVRLRWVGVVAGSVRRSSARASRRGRSPHRPPAGRRPARGAR